VAIQGELADFGAFYERTYRRAFGIAYGMTGERDLAEDVTQDAYVAAYRQRSSYRAEGPVDAWLYRIVVNAAISALRRRRVRFIVPLDAVGADPPACTASADDRLDSVALCEGLQRLDARGRSALVLRYYLDLDYQAIAGVLATSESNVGVILSRARDRLAELVGARTAAAADRQPVVKKAVWHG
jgi:RNA polymerase sigma factor (sigma-70 family)